MEKRALRNNVFSSLTAFPCATKTNSLRRLATNASMLKSEKGNTSPTASTSKQTVGGLLRATIDRWEHKDALVIKGEEIRYTWIELGKSVWSYADGLVDNARCNRGDSILNSVDSGSPQVILPFAASLADMIHSPIAPTATRSEIELCLRTLKPRLYVYPAKYRGSDKIKLVNELIPELSVLHKEGIPLLCKKYPSLRYLLQFGGDYQLGIHSVEDLRWVDASPSPLPSENEISPARPSFVYWNGDKAITFNDIALVDAAHAVAKQTNLSKDDRVCVATPLYTQFAFASGVLPCLHAAAVTVVPGTFFLPDMTLKCLARDSVTRLVCFPEQLEAMLQDPTFSRHDLSKLNTIVIGVQADKVDAPVLIGLLEKAKAAFKVKNIFLAYYHPLAAGSIALSTDGESAELLSGLQAKVDTASGKGELLLKGTTLTGGFWDSDTNKPQPMVGDGWLRLGVTAGLAKDRLLL